MVNHLLTNSFQLPFVDLHPPYLFLLFKATQLVFLEVLSLAKKLTILLDDLIH